MTLRFRDVARSNTFRDHYLVRCPRCDGRARLLNHDPASARGPRLAPTGCGYAKGWAGGHGCAHGRGGKLPTYRTRPRSGGGERYDPLDLEPWLQAPCRGETLWADNEEHLLSCGVTSRHACGNGRRSAMAAWRAACRRGSSEGRIARRACALSTRCGHAWRDPQQEWR